MFCTKCGKEIDDDATFCNFCGQPQEPELSAGPKNGTAALVSPPAVSQVTVGKLKGADSEITFANGMFASNGQPLTAQKLAELNSLELVDWKSDEMKLLALSQASQQAPAAPSPGASTPYGTVGYQPPAASGFTGIRDGRMYINDVDVTDEDPYWQEELKKIHDSNGAYKGKFNWAAFLGGCLWGFAKGLTIPALIWLAIGLVGGGLLYGIPLLVMWVIIGIRANYIRYMNLIEHKQVMF